MSKVLSIVGPTAVGKTALAFEVGRYLQDLGSASGVDLISADSRQVYQDLPIVSGADIPAEFVERQMPDWEFTSFFEADFIRLFGVRLLPATASWSVGQFQTYAQRVMQASWAAGRLPIVVGGTGLYVEHLFTTDPLLHVPPNSEVRQRAAELDLADLQSWLQQINLSKWHLMNESDRQNPRRLVRAIELSMASVELSDNSSSPENLNLDQLIIGLNDEFENIENKIAQRVQGRWQAGAAAEVERLQSLYPDQKLPLWSATGVKPLLAYANGQIDQAECLELWTRQERQYAKRQLTWWKKRTNVIWHQISQPEWQSSVLDQIEAWLSR